MIRPRHAVTRVTFALLFCLALTAPPSGAKATSIPSIDGEIIISGWWVIGPFPAGTREAGTDGLAYYGDAQPMSDPLLQGSFPSYMVPGGYARWRYYKSDESGAVSIDFPEVPEAAMELIVDEWGFAGASTKSYAFASIEIADGPRRALIDLQNAGSFSLNNMPFPGDAYGHRMGPAPVVLQAGRNDFKIAFGRSQGFSLRINPVEDDLMVLDNCATLPDLVRGGIPQVLAAVPLLNTTSGWIHVTGIEIGASDLYSGEALVSADIAPLALYNLPFSLPECCVDPWGGLEGDSYLLPITVHYDGGIAMSELKFRVREHDQSRRVTFRSTMDNSVQYYGLLPPSGYDPDSEYGLILSLHGAGVEAHGQVDAYQPKDWAFVVAPTNRRRFGFDWQDWGRLDMLEVLSDVKQRFPIAEDRVHLTGHSMGGHGTWYNALISPDLWASAAPSAGWTTFDLYVPMFLRRNAIVGDPRANMIWQLAMREDNTLVLAENALNLPIYALEGGADDNVPPQQPRMLVEELARRGYDIEYEEVPGMGHWWSKPATPFTDCVDNERHNSFWHEHIRDSWPRQVRFRTHNYSLNNQAYWVRVDAPQRAYRDVVVKADVSEYGAITVSTQNVRGLSLRLSPELVHSQRAELSINGQSFQIYIGQEAWVSFTQQDGHWWTDAFAPSSQKPFKWRGTYGPWRQAMMQPFVLVYGTTGTPEQTEWNLHMARLYAYHWWYRGNGHTEIIADTGERAQELNDLNAILLGGPDCNAVTARMIDRMPVRPLDSGLQVGDRLLPGDDLTYKFVHPSPDSGWRSLVLIEGGTSLEAMQRLPALMGVYSGGGFPDWMVWGDDVELKGFAGAHAVGFFDMDWRIADDLTYWNEELIDSAP